MIVRREAKTEKDGAQNRAAFKLFVLLSKLEVMRLAAQITFWSELVLMTGEDAELFEEENR